MKSLFILLSIFVLSSQASASETVKWTGIVKEEGGFHTTGHTFGHSLEFVRESDGKDFDIVDSAELENLHIQKEKNLLVEIEAQKTGKFLFWGGNLIVTNFKVLKELDDIPHRERARASNLDRGGRSR